MAAAENSSAPKTAQTERRPRNKKLKQLRKGKEKEEQLLNALESKPAESSSSKPPLQENVQAENGFTWSWTSLTNSSISPFPPLFTRDYRYFFIISGPSIKIHSTATGKVVSTLSSPGGDPSSSQGTGHCAEVTSILVNPRNAFQLISASLDGTIKIWDYLEAVLLSSFDLKYPITHMCAHDREPNYVFVITGDSETRKDNNNKSSKVFRVLLKPTKSTATLPTQHPLEKFKIGSVRCPVGVAISPSGEWLVVIGGLKAYVCALSSLGAGFTKFISNEPLTCIAMHPTEEYFATGDQKGQIRLWYCLDTSLIGLDKDAATDKRAQTTMLHWHAHAVSSLSFSSNGAYLLSGGEEAVLVIWQLHTGKKEFVPRVGAPIMSIAVVGHEHAEEEYLLGLSDGSLVMIASSSLRISKQFAKIKHNAALWGFGPAPLAVHTITSTVVLPSSHPSSLLVYSPSTSTAVAELDVSPSNRVSRREDKQIISSRVDRVVISHNGQWMATIDGRPGSVDFGREVYLKFWRWDSASSSWNLNCRIDRPHGPHRVVAMEFIPSLSDSGSYLLTCGEDRNVKAWRIRTIKSKAGKEEYWACRSTFGYRSKMPSNAAYSPDGSLIAVSYDEYAVIYDVASSSVRTVLTCPDLRNVLHMAFIGETGQYFVVTDNRMVHVWDLVALTVRWQYLIPQTIYHVIPHPKQDSFVVLSADQEDTTAVYKFMATSPSIEYTRTLPFKVKDVQWYPFGGTSGEFSVIGITDNWASVVFGDKINVAQDEAASAREISNDPVPQSRLLFQDIFGATVFDEVPSQPPPTTSYHNSLANTSKLGDIFSAPLHQLSLMGTLYPLVMQGLLHEREREFAIKANGINVDDRPRENEDTAMAMADVNKTLTRPSDRAFSSEEMQELIKLFKGDSFYSKTAPQIHMNGTAS